MVLAAHSDAFYLTKPKERSRAGGNYFMQNNAAKPANKGAVLTIAQIIKNIMNSASDAEIGTLYINSRQEIPAPTTVEEMVHKRPQTPIKTEVPVR